MVSITCYICINKNQSMGNRLKKKTKRSDLEDQIRCGIAMGGYEEEINIVKEFRDPGVNCVFPLHQRKLKLFEYEFLKTYLYALYTKVIENNDISIDNFNALASSSNPVIVSPDIIGTDDNGMAIVENQSVFVNLKYKNAAYQITVYMIAVQDGPYSILKYFISALGIEADSFRTIELVDLLVKESIRNSYYKNKILSITCDDNDRIDINRISPDKFKGEHLDNLFIPQNVKSELERFYECVAGYDVIGLGLRYLLCGEPGTGKTKSVRTLINMCYNKATIIIAEGEIDFSALFDFAAMFEPAILCIDDIDLLIGSRDRSFSPNSLGALLQELDGFEKNNVFMLATTNDKDLIDKAASRPGRFDMILDYNKISRNNYTELIESYCSVIQIKEALDGSVIAVLQKNKITGAYLVNLIKQLEVKYKLDPECDLREYIKNLINLTYRGFYKKTEEKQMAFGFGNYDGNGIDVIDL